MSRGLVAMLVCGWLLACVPGASAHPGHRTLGPTGEQELAQLSSQGVVGPLERRGKRLRLRSTKGFRRIPGVGMARAIASGYAVRLADGNLLFAHGGDLAGAGGADKPLPSVWSRFDCRPWDEQRRVVMIYSRRSTGTPLSQQYDTFNGILGRINSKLVISGGAQIRTLCTSQTQAVVRELVYDGTNDFASIVDAARASGGPAPVTDPLTKYLIFSDRTSPSNHLGLGEINEDSSPGTGNLANNRTQFAVVYAGWWETNTSLHELLHTMGAVQADAPYATGVQHVPGTTIVRGGHCYDGFDLMCYSDGGPLLAPDGPFTYSETRCPRSSYPEAALDCGGDTYFNPAPPAGSYLDTHWNVGGANNGFLRHDDHYIPPGASAPDLRSASSWTAVDPYSGDRWLYRVGSDSAIVELAWNGENWSKRRIGGAVSAGTVPTVLRDPESSWRWVYYRGTDGAIWGMPYHASVGWGEPSRLGGAVAPNTSPTVVRDSVNGYIWVYFRGTDGAIWGLVWAPPINGGPDVWQLSRIGGSESAGGSPAAVRDDDTGRIWVHHRGADGAMWVATWLPPAPGDPDVWTTIRVGGNAAADATPAVLHERPTNVMRVFFRGADGGMYEADNTGPVWSVASRGGAIKAGTAPTVVDDPGYGSIWVYYRGDDDAIWANYRLGGSWFNRRIGGAARTAADASGTPTAYRAPDSGRIWVYHRGSGETTWGLYWSPDAAGDGWGLGQIES